MGSIIKRVYNPHQLARDQLISQFIVHQEVFSRIWLDIKGSSMTYPEQHYIVEGQRGMGKTTLLLRLTYEVESDVGLSSWLIPVILEEEAYFSITTLYKLWERIAKSLDLYPDLAGMFYSMEKDYHLHENYEVFCFNVLVEKLKLSQKKILLLVDNINEIFKNFSENESRRLREVLLTCSHIRLIGAASISLQAFTNYNEAFYNFFKIVSLPGLSPNATRALLLELGKVFGIEQKITTIVETQPERIEALRIMTGGVIRTIIFLFDIFSHEDTADALEDLEKVIEHVTPFYKHRMDELKPREREVVTLLCLNWDALRPFEIARKIKMDEAEVRLILRELEKVYFVQWKLVNDSKDFYQIHERFFNIWFLMRIAPKDYKKKIIWLVRFFTTWYSRDELKLWAKRHIESMERKSFPPVMATMLTNALILTGTFEALTGHKLIIETRAFLSKENTSLTELLPSEVEILASAKELYETGKTEQAMHFIYQEEYRSQCLLGNFHLEINQFDEAIQHFERALTENLDDVNAYIGLGRVYHFKEDLEKAKLYYEKALAIDSDLLKARLNLAIICSERKDYEQALVQYRIVTHLDAQNIDGWWGLGYVFQEQQKHNEAISCYQRALTIDRNHVGILVNLGLAYFELRDIESAIECFSLALEINPEDPNILNNLATVYYSSNRYEQAAVLYNKLIQINKDDFLCWYYAGRSYFYLQLFASAKEYIQTSLSLNPKSSLAWTGLAEICEADYKFETAFEAYKKAFEFRSSPSYWIKSKIYDTFWKFSSAVHTLDSLKTLDSNYNRSLTVRLDFATSLAVSLLFPSNTALVKEATLFQLPFYKRYKLLMIPSLTSSSTFLLTDGNSFLPLDGSNAPIYSTNETDLDLISENLIHYCTFFFDTVVGKHGKFNILRSVEDISWWHGILVTERLINKVAAVIFPPCYLGLEEGSHILQICMTFQDAIFGAKVHIAADTGSVSLSDEVLLTERLPIKEIDTENYRDKFAVLREKIDNGTSTVQMYLEMAALHKDVILDFEQALHYLNAAIELEPKRSPSWKKLAELYEETNQASLAIKAYEKAIELGEVGLHLLVARLLYLSKSDKTKALEFAIKAYESSQNLRTRTLLAHVHLWHHAITESKVIAQEFLNDSDVIKRDGKLIIKYLLHLCAENEALFVKQYIEGLDELSNDFFKPVYYLALKRLNSIDYKRMPNEFEKAINDLETEVNDLIDEYK